MKPLMYHFLAAFANGSQTVSCLERAELWFRGLAARGLHQMLLVASLLALDTHGVSVATFSPTFAATSVTVSGQSADQPSAGYFSLQVVRPAVAAGLADSISANTLTDQTAAWSTDQFSGAGGAHYVEFDSGLMADIEGNSANTLVLAGNIVGLVAPGESYHIRPHTTLDSLFGADNSAGLIAATNPSEADNVLLFNVENQSTDVYWYSSVPGFEGWRNLLMEPAGDSKGN